MDLFLFIFTIFTYTRRYRYYAGDDGSHAPAGTRSYDLDVFVGFFLIHLPAGALQIRLPFLLRHRLWASCSLAQVLTC